MRQALYDIRAILISILELINKKYIQPQPTATCWKFGNNESQNLK